MRKQYIQLVSFVLALTLGICCLSACSDNTDQNSADNSTVTDGYYIDETTGDIIDASTGEVTTNDNLEVDETTGNIIDKTTGEIVQTTEGTSESEEETTNSTPATSETSNPTSSSTNTPTSTSCSHKKINTVGKVNATCTKDGYMGDDYCKDCGVLIASGVKTDALGHQSTEIRNYKEATATVDGYTGDTYCITCNTKVASGQTIPKTENIPAGKRPFQLNDGSTIYIEKDSDVTRYMMKQIAISTSHQSKPAELEILRLMNIERAKVGAQPLVFFEDAYHYTKIRANELFEFYSHSRPNKTPWYTAYTDVGAILLGSFGENIAMRTGVVDESNYKEIAADFFQLWMNSTEGHREAILNPKFTHVSIALVSVTTNTGSETGAVQNFFGD